MEDLKKSLWPNPQSIGTYSEKIFKFTKNGQMNIEVHNFNQKKCNYLNIIAVWESHKPSFDVLNISIDFNNGKFDHNVVSNGTPSTSENDEFDLENDNTSVEIVQNFHVYCTINSALFSEQIQSYRLIVQDNSIELSCNDLQGLNYGLITLCQIIKYSLQNDTSLPCLVIHDHPSIVQRGIVITDFIRLLNPDNLDSFLKLLVVLKINQIFYEVNAANENKERDFCISEITKLMKLCDGKFIQVCPIYEIDHSIQTFHVIQDSVIQIQNILEQERIIYFGPRLSKTIINLKTAQKYVFLRSFAFYTIFFTDIDDAELPLCSGLISSKLSSRASYSKISLKTQDSLTGNVNENILALQNSFNKNENNNIGGFILGKCVESCAFESSFAFTIPAIIAASSLSWNTSCRDCDIGLYFNDRIIENIFYNEDKLLEIVHTISSVEVALQPTLLQLLISPNDVILSDSSVETLINSTKKIRSAQSGLPKFNVEEKPVGILREEIQFICELVLWLMKLGRALCIAGRNPLNEGSFGFGLINPGTFNLQPTAKTDLANKLLSCNHMMKATFSKRYMPYVVATNERLLNQMLVNLVPETQDQQDPDY